MNPNFTLSRNGFRNNGEFMCFFDQKCPPNLETALFVQL